MSYLLDTNIISEFASPIPNAGVINWLNEHEQDDLYLSVVTLGEIQQGIERLSHSRKRTQLTNWLHNSLLVAYADFILPLDTSTMLQWGIITAECLKKGRKMPVMDGLIAATAVTYNLALVTHNTADFQNTSLSLIDPWHL